jgi:hypothetical protein
MMKRTTIVQAVLALALLVLPAMPASALSFMTFVASNGLDTNDCASPATACRHISRALAVADALGQVNCVDSADYFEGGTVITIAKTVTIDCQHTGDLPAFEVNGAGIVVTLRNFDLIKDNSFSIEFTNGATLILQNVHMSENFGNAIRFAPIANAQLVVSDCLINNNTSGIGILIKPASGVQTSFTIQRTVFQGNQWGIAADGTAGGSISGMVRDTVVTGNTQAGIITQGSGPNVTVSVDNVSVTSNGTGLWAQDGTAILTRRSFITGNTTGVRADGSGAVFSYGDNSLNANTGANGAFSAQVGLK